MEEYLSLLSEEEKSRVLKSVKSSSSLFRFGDGKESRSTKSYVIPVVIAGVKTEMVVDVVNNEIPLLISKPTMKTLQWLHPSLKEVRATPRQII